MSFGFKRVVPAAKRVNIFTQDLANTIAAVPGQEQLHWLHSLHTAIADILCSLTATKVDTSGGPRSKISLVVRCNIPKW